MGHIETVQAIYTDFGQGNVPAILARLDENVEWEYGDGPGSVAWLEPRRGRDNVAAFFTALHAVEFNSFVPKRFLAEGDLVIVLLDVTATVKESGRRFIETDEVHLWYFTPSGLVSRFRHRVDTLMQAQALRPITGAISINRATLVGEKRA